MFCHLPGRFRRQPLALAHLTDAFRLFWSENILGLVRPIDFPCVVGIAPKPLVQRICFDPGIGIPIPPQEDRQYGKRPIRIFFQPHGKLVRRNDFLLFHEPVQGGMDFFRPFLDPGQLKGIVLTDFPSVLDFLALQVAFFHQAQQIILVTVEPVTGFPAQLHVRAPYYQAIKRRPVRAQVFHLIPKGRRAQAAMTAKGDCIREIIRQFQDFRNFRIKLHRSGMGQQESFRSLLHFPFRGQDFQLSLDQRPIFCRFCWVTGIKIPFLLGCPKVVVGHILPPCAFFGPYSTVSPHPFIDLPLPGTGF